MSNRSRPRPGGRSARVQAAVHQAVREIEQAGGREALTVPAIAARAGVTPSTIYRRWGDLPQLLSDVAVQNLRPDCPRDTGSFAGDMEAWLAQYVDEMASDLGRTMLRDVLSNPDPANAGQCGRYYCDQIDVMRARAAARGEPVPDGQTLQDLVLAPLIYRILFSADAPDMAFARALLARVLREDEAEREGRAVP